MFRINLKICNLKSEITQLLNYSITNPPMLKSLHIGLVVRMYSYRERETNLRLQI
jgi:hypothetical protein